MAKVQKIPVGRKPGQRGIDLPEHVQVSLAELAGAAKEGLLAFAVGVGRARCSRPCSPKTSPRSPGPRAATTPSELRTATARSAPRSPSVDGGRRWTSPGSARSPGRRFTFPRWSAFSGDELLGEMALERMVAGLSTRHYGAGLEPVGDLKAFGTSRSSVSRRFVHQTKVSLSELMSKDLSETRFCALLADGIEIAEHTIVVALGIDEQGRKHPLGLREGTTENEAVCKALLSDLVDRGLDASQGILVVIDGGKGLRAAVRKVFGALGLVQRCRIHKRRNVLDHLPKELHARVGRRLDRAWAETNPERALRSLKSIAGDLEDAHPGAAASLHEGMEETLTITRLGLPPSLTRTLYSTNTIESMISVGRTVTRNVKRWRSGKMIERWCAAGMEVAARQFRKVKGYREIPILLAALRAHAEKVSEGAVRIA